jgi:FkbM family methyltransferase
MSWLVEAREAIEFVWTHPANRGRRIRQLGRATRFQLAGRALRRRAQTDVGHNGARIWVDLHRSAATKALYANPPDWPNMVVWERYLSPGQLFVDVGANVGTYAVLAASQGAEVIAIEPAADTARLLRENARLNGYDIRIVEQAVGAQQGTARFSSGQDSVNRIDPDGPVSVPMVTLDQLVGDRQVAGMKLDIEGYELAALQGAARMLEEHRVGLIQIEWNFLADRRPIAELLAAKRYELLEAGHDGSLHPYQGSAVDDLFAAPRGCSPSRGD